MTVIASDPLLQNRGKLLEVAKEVSPCMSGQVTNIFVEPYDEPSFQGNKVLTRARIIDPQGSSGAEMQRSKLDCLEKHRLTGSCPLHWSGVNSAGPSGTCRLVSCSVCFAFQQHVPHYELDG